MKVTVGHLHSYLGLAYGEAWGFGVGLWSLEAKTPETLKPF